MGIRNGIREWARARARDRKSTRLNSSHGYISYAVFCLKKKKKKNEKVHEKKKNTNQIKHIHFRCIDANNIYITQITQHSEHTLTIIFTPSTLRQRLTRT